MPTSRKVDISALYDELLTLRGTWVLCADLVGLHDVNKNYGYAAGDMVIAEAVARLDASISGDMMMFRVGGDEFAVVTGYESEKDAKCLAGRIKALNRGAIVFGGQRIPVSIRIGFMQIPADTLKYSDLFLKMMQSIDDERVKE